MGKTVPGPGSSSSSASDDDHRNIVKLSFMVYPELIKTQKLSFLGVNFLIWKFKLSFILTIHRLTHLLNPTPEDPRWNEPNDNAKRLILGTLDNFLKLEYSEYRTPASIMQSILTRFNSHLTESRMRMLERYQFHRMAPEVDINQHIFRMRAMAKELKYAGVKIPDDTQAVILLNSLPRNWEADLEGLFMDLDMDGNRKELSFDNLSRRLRILGDVRKWREFNNNGGKKLKKKVKSDNCGKQGSSDQSSSSSQRHIFPFELNFPDTIYQEFKTSLRIDYNGSDFRIWDKQFFLYIGFTKYGYVFKGRIPSKPLESASQEDVLRYKKWLTDDFTCRHLILGAMEDDLFLSFHDYPTAQALIVALRAFFKFTSTARRSVVLKKYMNHRMSDDTPVRNHVLMMDSMVWKNGGIRVPDEMRAVVLVNSLPESWEDTVQELNSEMCTSKPEGLCLYNVKKRIVDAGHWRELMAQREEESMFHDNRPRKKRRVRSVNCYSCGKPGHYQSNCPDKGRR